MATTRVTRVSLEAGAAPEARTRLSGLSFEAGYAGDAKTRLTAVSFEAGPAPSTIGRTRITEVSFETGAFTPFALTRITEVEFEAGGGISVVAALPSVFYHDGTDYRPISLLTMDDYPWT